MSLPRVSSSMVSGILRVDPWSGPWRAWLRLNDLAMPQVEKPIWRRGWAVERHVIPKLWALDEERPEIACGPALSEPGFLRDDWMRSHPDFTYGNPVAGALEAKSVRNFRGWGVGGTAEVPEFVAAQSLWHQIVVAPGDCFVPVMAVMGDAAITVATLAAAGRQDEIHPDDLARCWHIYRVPFQEKIAAGVLAFVRNWYEHHIIEGNPPEIDGSPECRHHIVTRVVGTDRFRQATPEERALASDLSRTRQLLKKLKAEEKELGNRLLAAIDDSAGLVKVAKVSRFLRFGKPVTQLRLDNEIAQEQLAALAASEEGE